MSDLSLAYRQLPSSDSTSAHNWEKGHFYRLGAFSAAYLSGFLSTYIYSVSSLASTARIARTTSDSTTLEKICQKIQELMQQILQYGEPEM